MSRIEGYSSSKMTEIWKAADAENVTKADVAENKTAEKTNKTFSRAINNPADNVNVMVPNGKINKVLKEFDDKTIKGQVKADHFEGRERNTIPGDFVTNEHKAPAVFI